MTPPSEAPDGGPLSQYNVVIIAAEEPPARLLQIRATHTCCTSQRPRPAAHQSIPTHYPCAGVTKHHVRGIHEHPELGFRPGFCCKLPTRVLQRRRQQPLSEPRRMASVPGTKTI